MVKNIVRALVSGREPATAMKGSTLMSTTRILWTLLLTGTLALAATGTQAQSIAQPGQSQERQDPRSDEHSKQGRPWGIVGSWFGTTTTGLRQLITFHCRWNRPPLGARRSQHRPRTSAAHRGPWRLALPWRRAVRRDDVGPLLRRQHGPAASVTTSSASR